MSPAADRLLGAIAQGAAEATGAAGAAIVGRREEEVYVVAVGGRDPGRAVGQLLPPGEESLGFVLASGQTMSVAPRPVAPSGREGVHRAAAASLCVPCLGTEGVLGALELRAEPGSDSFPPEASRLATLFADVAAAALVEGGLGVETGPSAAELAGELARLEAADPNRYAAVASVVSALLAHA